MNADADQKLALFPRNQSKRLMRVQSVSVKSAQSNSASLLIDIYLLSIWIGKLIQLFWNSRWTLPFNKHFLSC